MNGNHYYYVLGNNRLQTKLEWHGSNVKALCKKKSISAQAGKRIIYDGGNNSAIHVNVQCAMFQWLFMLSRFTIQYYIGGDIAPPNLTWLYEFKWKSHVVENEREEMCLWNNTLENLQKNIGVPFMKTISA